MSRFHEGYVWRFSKAKGNARLALLALAEAADDDGFASLTHAQIAARIGAAEDSMRRLIADLTGIGCLHIAGEATGRSAAVYRVNVDWRLIRDAFSEVTGINQEPHSFWVTEIPPGQPDPLTAAPERAETEGPQVEETADIEGPDDDGNSPAAQEAPVAGGAVQPLPPPVSEPIMFHPAPPPVTVATLPTQARPAGPPIPAQFPKDDVGRILVAAGVDPLARGALYWWRRDHRMDLCNLREGVNMTVDQIVKHLTSTGQKHPDIARLTALEDSLKGADRG